MAGSVNKVTLVGNLGRDPEVRHTQGNQKIVHLSVATSERWKDRSSGEQREKTEWHRVVIFNERLAEVAEKYLAKGRTVYLEGALQTRKWTDQQGQEKYSTEVVLTQFRGELVLLGGGRGEEGGRSLDGPDGEAAAIDDGWGQTPASRPAARAPAGQGRGAPAARAPAGNGRPAGRSTLADDLDDDIPF